MDKEKNDDSFEKMERALQSVEKGIKIWIEDKTNPPKNIQESIERLENRLKELRNMSSK